MLDPRTYRAALVPVLLALIVVAFSLEDRPGPLRTTLAADAFDGPRAARLLERLVRAHPDRRPGSAGDAALAATVARELRAALPGVTVRRSVHRGATVDGDRDLVLVRAQQPGSTSRAQVVVVAARDAVARGSAAQLSGTAALIELARIVADTRPSRSVTFASVSGGTGGQEGMRELVRRLDRPVDAVLELGDLAGPPAERPLVVGLSDGVGAAPVRLQRTVALALRQETGIETSFPFARAQLARFAWPFSVSGQGVANAAGLPAVRLSASGEQPPAADAPVTAARLGGFGRTALRVVTALENGPRAGAAPQRDLAIARKVLPAWAVRLLAIALLLPAVVVVIDGVARLRRRREPVLRGVLWVLVLAAPFALAALFARSLGLLGWVAATAPPALPSQAELDGRGWAAIGCVLVVLALGFLLLRPWLARRAGVAGPPDAPGRTLAPALVAAAGGTAACILNPYAALALALPANLWLLLAARELRLRRVPAVLLVLVSLAPAALVIASDAAQLAIPAGEVPWFGTLMLAGGQPGPLALLGWCAMAGAAVGALLVALRPAGQERGDAPITVRGPSSYAGPGSLGGTDSALRR
jgi:hypothetical protein